MHTFKTLKHLAYSISLCVLLVGCYKMGGKDEQKNPTKDSQKDTSNSPSAGSNRKRANCTPIDLYVNGATASSGNGSSFAQAFKTIPEAVKKVAEIRALGNKNPLFIAVAQGTHKPDTQINIDNLANISLMGGFPITAECQEDISPTEYSVLDFSLGVSLSTRNTASLLIGGFMVQNSNSASSPFYLNDGNVQLKGMRFTDNNSGSSNGGAIHIRSASVELTNCTFWGNSSDKSGGAIHIYSEKENVEIKLKDCVFGNKENPESYKNQANESGGAIYVSSRTTAKNWAATLVVEDSQFYGNVANESGGAIAVESDVKLSLVGSVGKGSHFIGNACSSSEHCGSALLLHKNVVFKSQGVSNLFKENKAQDVVEKPEGRRTFRNGFQGVVDL